MNEPILVFDLDGVIVKTNFVKHDAMLSLFADHPQQQDAISNFILSNGGVPRKEKLAHLLRVNLRVEPTEAVISTYLCRYAKALEHQLAEAPMVEGVADFIASYRAPRYVCSSAPDAEVYEQLAHRAISTHLAGIYGNTMPKSNALRLIAQAHADSQVVFFGDSVGDYRAACEASVAFVGVVSERDNFKALPVVKLADFAHREAVEKVVFRFINQIEGDTRT